MGLTTALSTALSGLKVTQTGLELVSSNVANAETPGYTRKNTALAPVMANDRTIGVRVTEIQRSLDSYVQKQLRAESSSLSYANINAAYTDRLQQAFGTPGTASAFSAITSRFVSSLDDLVTSPESLPARTQALSDGQALAQSLNNLSSDVQAMRQEANQGLQDTTTRINSALAGLEKVSKQLTLSGKATPSPDVLDQRDRYISELSELADLRVTTGTNGVPSLSTTSGITLFANGVASKLSYEGSQNVSAQSLYSPDPAQSNLGTVMVTMPGGMQVDLLNPRTGVRSGAMKAYAELRDTTLPQAQTQLDEIAAVMAKALGSSDVAGTAVVGPPAGFQLDLANVQPGDSFTLNYTEEPAGTARTVTFFRVDDAASLPLSNDLTADPNDRVVGIDFSGGYAAAATAIGTALGAGFTASNPAGATLEITGDGGVTRDVGGLNGRVTNTALQGQGTSLPFFVDSGNGNGPYTGNLDGIAQRTGFAGRIAINSSLLSDPSLLVNYTGTTSQADPTRPAALRDALESLQLSFRADTGIGGASAPFKGSLVGFSQQIVETQARQSEVASRVAEGQSIVVTSLQDRFAESSGVDVNQEMGKLIELQNAYAANARVITAVREMFDLLMRS
jgi:flagellar hook-associated protein 1